MSVPKSQRGESKLEVFLKAEDLVSYTIHICSNERHFPKKYRWCVTSKLVDSAIEMYNDMNKANSIFVKSELDFNTRRAYQKKALSETYAILSMIKIAYVTFAIQTKTIETWTTKIMDTQKLLRGWIEHDEKVGTEFNK